MIIPTIIAKNFQELQEKVRKVEPYVQWVHLDIMDGRFVSNTTWDNPEELKNLDTSLNLEAHLMIEKPWESVGKWLEAGVKRIIVHWEAFRPSLACHSPACHCEERSPALFAKSAGRSDEAISIAKNLVERIHKENREIGIALNPETPLKEASEFILNNQLDLVLIMSVKPGYGGQEFKEEVLPKIKSLRKIWPDGNIEVDGGVNLKTCPKAIQAGADILAVGSTIFRSKDIEGTIESLKLCP